MVDRAARHLSGRQDGHEGWAMTPGLSYQTARETAEKGEGDARPQRDWTGMKAILWEVVVQSSSMLHPLACTYTVGLLYQTLNRGEAGLGILESPSWGV